MTVWDDARRAGVVRRALLLTGHDSEMAREAFVNWVSNDVGLAHCKKGWVAVNISNGRHLTKPDTIEATVMAAKRIARKRKDAS